MTTEGRDYFYYKEIPDPKKVKLVAMKLSGRATAWWNQNKQMRH